MASRGVNKVIVVGNLGNDPEIIQSQSGAITKISVATSESWTDKNTGEKQQRTEWHRVVFFGKLAEIAGEYLRKGSQVYIEGSLQTSKYTDKDGVEKYSTDIKAKEMQMLDSRDSGGASGGTGAGSNQPNQNWQAPQEQQAANQNANGTFQGNHTPHQAPPANHLDDDFPY